MRTSLNAMIASVGLVLATLPATAHAAPTFDVAPETDVSLSAMTGTWRPSYNARLLIQSDASSFLRQSGEISRLQMDNWWADVGSALIGANLLMQR